MEFYLGQEIKVDGRKATVMETGLKDAYGHNSIRYKEHATGAVIVDNPALSSYYAKREFKAVK